MCRVLQKMEIFFIKLWSFINVQQRHKRIGECFCEGW